MSDEERSTFYRCPACEFPHIPGQEPESCPLRFDAAAPVVGGATVISDAPAAAEAARPSRLGMLLGGRYVLEQRIGEGGVGEVYRAKDLRIGRYVALKALRGRFDAEATTGQRFLREGRLMSEVTHPGVAKVLDFGIENNATAYLVMELLSGESLEEALEREEQLPVEVVCVTICEVLATLSVMHARGIIHCDIKPGNIFLHRAQGQAAAKLLDFGLSKETRASSGRITETGVINGTPYYIAPEMLRGQRPDAGCDLYAVGMILYEALAGDFPMDMSSERIVEVFTQILEAERIPIEAHCPELSPDLAVAINRAARVRGEPFTSATEMLEAIDDAMGGAYRNSELAHAVPMASGERRLPD